MNIKLAIFDLDGTTLDTLQDLADAVNHALRAQGLPEHTADEVRSYIGNGIRNLIDRSVPADTPEEVTALVFAAFKSYYAMHCKDKTCPYPGVMQMLERLKKAGMKIAILSNKADFAVQELCAQYFPGMIDYAAGEKAGVPKKPSPESVYALLKTMGCRAEEAVYIGDSEVDVLTAENAGMKSLIVDWGFRSREQLVQAGAKNIFSTTEELTEALLK